MFRYIQSMTGFLTILEKNRIKTASSCSMESISCNDINFILMRISDRSRQIASVWLIEGNALIIKNMLKMSWEQK